jgi:hypothetical protein
MQAQLSVRSFPAIILAVLVCACSDPHHDVTQYEFMQRVCTGTCLHMDYCGELPDRDVDACEGQCLEVFCPTAMACDYVYPESEDEDISLCYADLDTFIQCPFQLPLSCTRVEME